MSNNTVNLQSQKLSTRENDGSKIQPTAETEMRIGHLADAANAIFSLESESRYDTDVFVAREGLNKFIDRIHNLNLPPKSVSGMERLVEMLREKLEERQEKKDKF